jgi:uroporphyrinogen decarboxylase
MAKTLLRALAGEAIWPPPLWLMRQAGRYLPEYREVRARAGGFIELCTTPALATEVTLQPLRRFGFDAAILFSDILMLPWALGQELRYAEGEGPLLSPVHDAADLRALDASRLPDAIAPILETVRRVRAEVGDAALLGFAGGPFTVACYMVQGRGSKEWDQVRRMAWSDPGLFAGLIDLLTEQTIVYLSAQIDAGAEAVMLFDSWAGVLAPSLFRAHVVEPSARIVAAIRASHPDVPVIGFPRQAGTMLAEFVRVTDVQGIGVDTSADLAVAMNQVPGAVAIQGNLDPLVLLAGGQAMMRETDAILAAMRGRAFIFNLGHGIVPQTPPAHVEALVARVRAV